MTHDAGTFSAVTWNVYHGTATKTLTPILAGQVARGVTLLLMQEADGNDITAMLDWAGLDTYVTGQYRVAWSPDRWVLLDAESVRLSDAPWYAPGSEKPRYSDAAKVLLCDRVGRSLTAVSYHTPSHVQVPEGERPERRYAAMMDSFRTLGDIADDAHTTGFLAGGDDNWDESTGLQTPEARAVLLGQVSGLRQIQSPEGTSTHGKHRRIDDFRIPRGGTLGVNDGWVAPGGGDHKLHGRKFRWRL